MVKFQLQLVSQLVSQLGKDDPKQKVTDNKCQDARLHVGKVDIVRAIFKQIQWLCKQIKLKRKESILN